MCGRYSLRINAGTKVPGIDCEMPELKARYNLTPSQDGIIVRLNEAGEMVASIAKWGFCPGWMKDPGKAQANARGETLAEKPMFRAAFKKTRCLVIIDSFYEWDRKVKPTQPYSIQRKDGEPMVCAGIWTDLNCNFCARRNVVVLKPTAGGRRHGEEALQGRRHHPQAA